MAQAAADLLAGSIPGLPGEQPGTGVGPPAAGWGEDVPAAQRLPQPFEHAEGVGAAVELPVGGGDQALPHPGGELCRHLVGRHLAPPLQISQRVQRGKHRLAAGGGAQLQAVEQSGQEPAYVAVTGEQLLGPRLRLSGQLTDRVHRVGELCAGHAALFQGSPQRE